MKEKRISKMFNEKRKYIFTLIVTFVLLSSIVLYTFCSYYTIAREDAISVGQKSLVEQSEQLNSFLLQGMDVLHVTGLSVDYMLQSGSTREEIEAFLLQESEEYIEHIGEKFTGIYGLFNGEYIDGIGWVPDAGFDPKSRPWYIEAKEGKGKTVVISPYLDARTNSIMISVSQMLSDGESVISLDIVMDEMQDFAESIRLNGKGYGFIVDDRGMVVAHSDEMQKGKNYLLDDEMQGSQMQELVKQILAKDEEVIPISLNGNDCIVFSREVQDSWHVVMVVNTFDLFEKMEKNLLINVGLAIIVFGIFAHFCIISNRNHENTMLYADELKDYQLTLEERVEEKTEELRIQQNKIEKLFMQTVVALSEAVDAKDRYTSGHSKRVAEYARMIAARLGKSKEEQDDIYRAGLLHDVGKIRIPAELINKPGKLTDEEYNTIKLHPVTGYHILRGISDNNYIAVAAKYHHERYDGKGYPNGLAGEKIPEVARILGVADSYDAMASNRSYRKALSQEVVRSEIEKGKGTQFDPCIADIMLQMIDEDKDYTLKQTDSMHRRILTVDEEALYNEIITQIMRDEPMYEVISAGGGREALEILEQQSFDLILLDVKSKEKDGLETLKLIREKYQTPIVLMTSDKTLDILTEISEYGCEDYITKPFLPILVKEIVHNMTERTNIEN